MAYTTVAQVRTGTGFKNSTKISDARLTALIADADSVIDSAIGKLYTVPLAVVPEIIETISRNITTALAYTDEYGEEAQLSDKGWKERLEYWLAQLDRIVARELILVHPTTGVELTRSTLFSPSFSPNNETSAAGGVDEPRMSFQDRN